MRPSVGVAPHRFAIVLTCVLGVAVAGCRESSTRREYTLQGQILSVSPDRTQASIKHDEIPGFMAAMTMTYTVREPGEFASIGPGDLITSRLVVLSDGAYLEQVRTVGRAPLDETTHERTLAAPASSGFELLKPGEAVLDVTFLDQDGRSLAFSSLQGSPLVLTFIYTSCPLPTFCPLMDRHFVTLQKALARDPALDSLKLVSISFDPLTDTPEVLRRHAARLGADPRRWRFLTGDRDEVDRFAARFGVAITRDLSDPRDIAHNLRTAIVDAHGRLVKAYTGNEWTPADVLRDLGSLGLAPAR